MLESKIAFFRMAWRIPEEASRCISVGGMGVLETIASEKKHIRRAFVLIVMAVLLFCCCSCGKSEPAKATETDLGMGTMEASASTVAVTKETETETGAETKPSPEPAAETMSDAESTELPQESSEENTPGKMTAKTPRAENQKRPVAGSGHSASGQTEALSKGDSTTMEDASTDPATDTITDDASHTEAATGDPRMETSSPRPAAVTPESVVYSSPISTPALSGNRLEGVNYDAYLPVPSWAGRGGAAASLAMKYGGYYTKNADQKVIFLTFCMDYENGYTNRMMDTLSSLGVPAAFFITGTYLSKQPQMAKNILNRGYILGSHSYRHVYNSELSDVELINDFVLTQRLFNQVLGYPLRYYRPASGFITERDMILAQRFGLTTVMFSFNYFDYDLRNQPSSWQALEKLKSGLRPGAIYYLHVTPCNIQALPEFVSYARSLGYSFLRLDQSSPSAAPTPPPAPTAPAAPTEAPTAPPATIASPTTPAATTTAAPTTPVPATEAPTTQTATTTAPTTTAPTTSVPTTEASTTAVPATEAPTTSAPTTEAPTTEAPTTEAPPTEAPPTEAPTEAPTTTAPPTDPATEAATDSAQTGSSNETSTDETTGG